MFGRGSAVVLAACVLALAGCTFEGAGSTASEATEAEVSAVPTPPSASPTPSAIPSPTPTPSATPTPVPVKSPGQTLVSMTVSGGFAGVSQKVVLRGDGTVHARDGAKSVVRRAGAAEFEELRLLLGDPALDDVSDFAISMSAADLFQYEVRFEGRTVLTDRSAEQPPLDRLIDTLSEFLPKN